MRSGRYSHAALIAIADIPADDRPLTPLDHRVLDLEIVRRDRVADWLRAGVDMHQAFADERAARLELRAEQEGRRAL